MADKQMRHMKEIIDAARAKSKQRKRRIIVVAAHNADILEAAIHAETENIADLILVGDIAEMNKIAKERKFDLSMVEMVEEKDFEKAAQVGIKFVKEGKADMIMKGLLPTATIMKAILSKESGLRREDRTLSHVAVMEFSFHDRFFYLTDAGIVVSPTIEQKKMIIENAVEVAHILGNKCPNVALISALEFVNPKMPSTVHAHEVEKLYKEGKITGCRVQGPLALDDAISEKVAREKMITGEVAGKAEILVAENVETGNPIVKAMMHFGRASFAGVVMGAKIPLIVTSRSDSEEFKFNSICLGILLAP